MAAAASRWLKRVRNGPSRSVPKPSVSATTSRPASRGTTFRKGGRSRSRSSAPKARSKMAGRAAIGEPAGYVPRVSTLVRRSATQLLRPASQPRAALAVRRLGRQSVLLVTVGGIAIAALIYWLDAYELTLMPPRGAAALWPVRILTDFGKDANVVAALVIMLVGVTLISPALHGPARLHLMRLGLNLQFFLAAVVVPLLAGELIKWVVGRGRPFVGGHANPFNFEPFAGTEAYASFPSPHAITSAAVALAVAAAWPRARGGMIVYAVAIAATRA